MEHDFEHNNEWIEFYKKENDEKFSFRVRNKILLTDQLLSLCNNKRIKEKDIPFAKKGIIAKLNLIIKMGNELTDEINDYNRSMIELNEAVQMRFKKSLTSKVIDKEGVDHAPVITVGIQLPTGEIFTLKGNPGENKRVLKNRLAREIIEEKGWNL